MMRLPEKIRNPTKFSEKQEQREFLLKYNITGKCPVCVPCPEDTYSNETNENENIRPMEAKLKILEDELKIIEETNLKFMDENSSLKTNINNLDTQISNLKKEITSQKEKIDKFNLDTEELEFLRLNLEYSHKCRKSFFNSKGFSVGTADYKNCILNKGRNING